jgi:hypothetical protein
MNARRWILPVAACLLAFVLVLGASPARAVVVFDFVRVISGTPPIDPAPWAKLQIEDDTTDVVKFTLKLNWNSSNNQPFAGYLLLNVEPFVSVSLVPGSVSGGGSISGFSSGLNSFTDAGSTYDVKIKFDIAPPGVRLIGGESLTWKLTGTGLAEGHFKALSAPLGDPTKRDYALLHVQGTGENGQDSGKLGVIPEPATLILFGMGLAAPLAARRRKR